MIVLAGAQRRAHRAHHGDRPHRPVDQGDVAERRQQARRGRPRLNGRPFAGEQQDRQIGPRRLPREHVGELPDRRRNQHFLGEQHHRRAFVLDASAHLGHARARVAGDTRPLEQCARQLAVATRGCEHQRLLVVAGSGLEH
jgi:hypothetical protein